MEITDIKDTNRDNKGQYKDNTGWGELQRLLPSEIVTLVAISKAMQAAELCSNRILQFLTGGCQLSQVVLYLYSHKMVVVTEIANKPVGFYGPIAPPVRNAPISECPRALIAARHHAAMPPVQSEYPAESCAAAAVPLLELP